MYVKINDFFSANHVFDKIPNKNQSTWNTMISGYVRMGHQTKSFELYRKMQEDGLKPSGFILASLITACNRSISMFFEGIQVHGFIIKLGMLADVFIATPLVHFYGNYACPASAGQLFDEMYERNIVTWTSLMVAYSKNGSPLECVNIYRRMRLKEVLGNQNSSATVISSCGTLENEFLGLQVFAHVVVSGFSTDVSVSNSLITMLSNFGRVEDACSIFNSMETRDTISWNAMISAYSQNGFTVQSLCCFCQMRWSNIRPDSTTLSSLISSCTSMENLKWGKTIHGLAIQYGLEVVSVCNTLITMYSGTNNYEDAEIVFQLMNEKDLISWNSMISCYVQSGNQREAFQIFISLIKLNKGLDYLSFAGILTACSYPEDICFGKIIHGLIVQFEQQKNLLLSNALITMYVKCGAMLDAKNVFQAMSSRDVVTWNVLIGGYVENEEKLKAIEVFKWMREDGIQANYITMVNVLGSCSEPSDLLKYGKPIHSHLVSIGLDLNIYVMNSLLTMYAKCGELNSSRFIFDQLADKNVVSWNAMISVNARQGSGEEALKLFREMCCTGLELDRFSLSGAIAASSSLAILEEGQQLHSLIIKLGFSADLHVVNAIMDMYGKCGKMDDVLKVIPESMKRDRLSWNILISSLSRHGLFEKARDAFNEMVQMGQNPDYITFVCLLSACNHTGLVDEGLNYFSLMSTKFGISPGVEHCVCIVDLLGRSGRLSETENFIRNMKVPPNDLVWRSLLASCKKYGNLELGKKAAECLIELDPSDDSAYVLLSNVCAVSGKWEDVERVRDHMKIKNVKKKPACSWIKMKNKVTTFGIGDRYHPHSEQIYTKLKEILHIIKEMGYIADTSYVLHDTDDEQKEHNLWNHSEKLALSYGLIETHEGSTIRVFKNLRVCGDCHSVYKFVSKAFNREIFLRDPYRFHHFTGGKCSCSDYW